MLFLTIFLGIWALIGTYSTINLLHKNEVYDNWMRELTVKITQVYTRIRIIDDKEIFEKDDEVGATFEDLRDVIFELEPYIEQEINDGTEI